MTSDIATRVAAGVAFLDEQVPGWVDKIAVDRLRIHSGTDCVLGQIFGGYEQGRAQLGLSSARAMALGFQRTYKAAAGENVLVAWLADIMDTSEYDALTTEWRRVVEILKAERAPIAVEEKFLVLV